MTRKHLDPAYGDFQYTRYTTFTKSLFNKIKKNQTGTSKAGFKAKGMKGIQDDDIKRFTLLKDAINQALRASEKLKALRTSIKKNAKPTRPRSVSPSRKSKKGNDGVTKPAKANAKAAPRTQGNKATPAPRENITGDNFSDAQEQDQDVLKVTGIDEEEQANRLHAFMDRFRGPRVRV